MEKPNFLTIVAMKKSIILSALLLSFTCFSNSSAIAAAPIVSSLPSGSIEGAIEKSGCNISGSPCVLPGDRVKNVKMENGFISAQFLINIPSVGGFHDWFAPGYNEKVWAKKYAGQFIKNLCQAFAGEPQVPMIKILKTNDCCGSGSFSVSDYPIDHVTSYSSDSFNFTMKAAVRCLRENSN